MPEQEPDPEQTYEIREGVRRTRAAWEAGHTHIRAQLDEEWPNGPVLDIPIASLRCFSKEYIDLSGDGFRRWMKVVIGVERGDVFPPIIIARGARGKPIDEIPVR